MRDQIMNLVTLDTIAREKGSVILPDFPAIVDGREVWVTAVFERTVVCVEEGQPKRLVGRGAVLVSQGDIRIRQDRSQQAAERGREIARKNRATQRTMAAALNQATPKNNGKE